MPRNKRKRGTKDKKWCGEMEHLSLHDHPHSCTVIKPATEESRSGSEPSAHTEVTQAGESSQQTEFPTDSGLNTSIGSSGSGMEKSVGFSPHPPIELEVQHSPMAPASREGAAMKEDEEEEKYPLTSLIPPECDSTECKEWGPVLKQLIVTTQGFEKLRPLFINNEKAWQKVVAMDCDDMKKAMELDGHYDETFLRILSAFVSVDVIRKRLGLSRNWAYYIYENIRRKIAINNEYEFEGGAEDLRQFWEFCNPGFKLAPNDDNYDA